ncbi:NfeD family protein [Desulfobacula phenolica]|uniref:NfeD-like C-terminal, partner-binding n=1 Tax=Desulfobacula phenolica TaxID=90732 RepID=A0A1H2IZ89_9BACT|nr:NfeD family protein [Desulfobacula phenolica]SDU49463.1 NfeD-like C-terminal, partner-binding [Desulfobacula phenolica]
MKPYILPVLLQILGILVIIAEIFIPSLGLLTVIALGLFCYSLYMVFTTISTTAGMVITGLDVTMIPVLIVVGMKILAKSPLALKQELSKQNGVVSQNQEFETYLHMKGKSVTDLRPAGIAEINSQRVDVVTDGEYIEADTPIIVTGVTGNRIIVEKNN